MPGRRPGAWPKNWKQNRQTRSWKTVDKWRFPAVGGDSLCREIKMEAWKNWWFARKFSSLEWWFVSVENTGWREWEGRRIAFFFPVREGSFKGQSLWRWLDRYWRMSLPNDINMWCSDAFILWISSSIASAACLCVGCETTCDTFSNGMSFGQLFFSCCKTWAQHFQRVGYVNSLEGILIRSYLYIPNS